MRPFDFTGCWVGPDLGEKMAASSRAQANEYSLELQLSTKVSKLKRMDGHLN